MMNDTVGGPAGHQRATRALQEVAEQMQQVARSYQV